MSYKSSFFSLGGTIHRSFRFLWPLGFVLFTSKAFVVIPLYFEELFEVRFAVQLALERCVVSQPEKKNDLLHHGGLARNISG